MAAADQRDKERGCRYYYWPKDLKADYRDDEITENDALVFIDVDFHCDMTEYLKLGQPILMYTLVPEHAAYRGTEHSYTIKDDMIDYHVTGGARYTHKIWDYDHETIAADDDEENTVFYNVEQRVIDGKVGGGRRIISLIPFVKIPTMYAYLMNPSYLERKIYTQNGVNVVYNNITDTISMSLNGSYQAIDTYGRKIEAIKQRLQAKITAGFTIGDIEQYLYDEVEDKTKTVKVEAALLYSIFERTLDLKITGNIISTSACVTEFTPTGPIVFQDTKPACSKLTTPLVTNPGIFPTKSINSELAAIDGRINKVKNLKIPPREYSMYAREFVKLMVPIPHTGTPWTQQQVIDVQNRPMQRARTARVLDFLGVSAPNKLKTFNKAESYPCTNDPRVITTCDPRLTLEMSRFTYAFKEALLKRNSWYGPGKNPKQSIKIIQKIATNGTIETDFTRFDGSISKFLQERIVFESYLRWVNTSEKDLMLSYLRQVFVKKGRTTSGIKYAAGWGTRSGSPITTDGNTMINAFISYSALRNIGYNEEKAWKELGIYAGDDGLNKVIPNLKESIIQACNDLGLDVKINLTGRNEQTTYLSRIFPAPLTHTESFQDPMRTLSKLHTSANKNVTREQAATNKAAGYLLPGEWIVNG
uniref:RNA replicase n=1 Tax=Caninovirus sp. TaxID=2022010 RepID=A0A221LEB7_9VIRU|nr:RdRp [Caninovirus sp.]